MEEEKLAVLDLLKNGTLSYKVTNKYLCYT